MSKQIFIDDKETCKPDIKWQGFEKALKNKFHAPLLN